MATRTAYYTPHSKHYGETSQMKRDYIHRVSKMLLIPRIIEKNEEALAVAPIDFFMFKRASTKSGRRCSCWYPTAETSPSKTCPNCWGVGIVPGYLKFGTKTEVIEPNRESVIAVNVAPNWAESSRPPSFKLLETATQGYIECSININKNKGVLDRLIVNADIEAGSSIRGWVRTPSDTDWVEFNFANVQSRLRERNMRIRFYLSRVSPRAPLPSIMNIYIRYVVSNPIVQANIPRTTEAETFAEIGIEDSIGSMTLWFINYMSHAIGRQDWFYKISDGTYWKVTDRQENDPLQISTSVDVTVRWIQAYENYREYPV